MTDHAFEVGAATHRARRETNEDQASAGSFPGGAYLLVADGVGGEAWGDVASRTALQGAEGSLLKQLHSSIDAGTTPDIRRMVQLAFRAAGKGLVRAAVDQSRRFGLKTTLIVALVWRDQLAIAYVGDGGLWCWQDSVMELEPLLVPMANEAGELAAVLSPWKIFEPQVCVRHWTPGSVLIAATDGIADPIPFDGIGLLARELHQSSNSVEDLLCQLLEACNAQSDDMGPIFDDNMGIAALRQRSAA